MIVTSFSLHICHTALKALSWALIFILGTIICETDNITGKFVQTCGGFSIAIFS